MKLISSYVLRRVIGRPQPMGDLDGDGRVTTSDALLVLCVAMAFYTLLKPVFCREY